jgi:subtilisin family serine protease
MRKTLVTVVGLLVVMAMLLAPMQTSAKAQTTIPPQAGRQYEALPQEVIDAFQGGMTVDEFLAQNKGPVPMALWDLTDQKIAVIIEMDAPSLISKLLADGKTPEEATAAVQRNYVAELLAAQEPLTAAIAAAGGNVLGQYTKVYNGVLALVPGRELNGLRSLPGVKTIHQAPKYEPTLSASVPLIHAPEVWASPQGYDGTDVNVAIIDTGIDYTHAALGGSGDASDYANNDPDIIEPGTFPTVKVVGGYDFAGTNYDANGTGSDLIPVPDPDPLDENSHGTHVASTAAGIGVPGVIGKGVAPAANLWAFKVFGAEGSTNLVVSALEMAMDPNDDGDLSDRVDVINMSLGSAWGAADPADPEQVAVDQLSQLGTVVVISAGNEGNSTYVTGQPGVSDAAISVAASTTGFITLPTVKYGASAQAPYLPAVPFTPAVTATLVDVDAIDGTFIGELCATTNVAPGALTGAIALIQRGTCNFSVKINNAQALGAVGAIVYNAAASANEYVSMALDVGETLPAAHTLRSYGLLLKTAHNTTVTVGPDSATTTFAYGLPDTVASFSSRGPRGFDAKLKPEITAPGVAIFAAGMGTGNEGLSLNGTSMAAPHVTGVAALMKQAHPTWTVEQIKAAMMDTADDLNAADTAAYRVVPRTGAGRVNAYDAVFTKSLAIGDPKLVSLSWGVVEFANQVDDYVVPETKHVTVQNLDTASKTYDISVAFTDTKPDLAASLALPPSVTVPAGASVAVPALLILHPAAVVLNYNLQEEYYGFVFFTPRGGGKVLRVPFYFVPRPYNVLSEVAGGQTTLNMDGSNMAMVDFNVTGPTTSNLYPWTMVGSDPNDSDVLDRADLRAVGMDSLGPDPNGNMLGVGFSFWGGVHTPQPYYSEADMYMDVDQDGAEDYVFFNFNYGWLTGATTNNTWVVIQIDLASGIAYLGSPYTIYADYNSGYMEWYLPDAYDGFNDANSYFDYSIVTFDGAGGSDDGPLGTFDTLTSPFMSATSDAAPAGGDTVSLMAILNDLSTFFKVKPEGIMLFDYNGKPGAGQSYIVPLAVKGYLFLPFLGK